VKIVAPLSVQQSKKKRFSLNLNVYRNSHFFTLNKAKKDYKAEIQSQFAGIPVMQRVELTFTLYPKTKRLCDISNVLSIHDKFFCDALVEAGKIPDDNYLHLKKVTYMMGEVDKDNPRVEIFIEEI
jgi:Holliday junction resolvase RusA-like endonuclease